MDLWLTILYILRGHLYNGISKVQQHDQYSMHGGLKVYNYLGLTKRKSKVPNKTNQSFVTESDMSSLSEFTVLGAQ